MDKLTAITAITGFTFPKTETFLGLIIVLFLVVFLHFSLNSSRGSTPVTNDLINAPKNVPSSIDGSSSARMMDDSEITSECSSEDGIFDEPLHANRSRRLSTNRCQAPIAVVGMACRLPGHCNSPQALWDFLARQGIAKNEPPASRFSLSGHFDKHRRPATMKSPGGMFMEDVDPELFDGQFFNISRADCIAMDPQQRQLLEVTYECLESAGITLEAVDEKAIGCLVGANAVDYESIQARDPEDRPASATIGVARAILSNRISHFLNIKGPSMTIDTACSGSLVSLDVACRYLDSHQADGMIVAGANMWMNPEHNEEIGMMRATQSASGKCHTFDSKADGYVKAEAINAVFIKRLSDAIRDGDPIRAVIRGTSTNSAGRTPGMASPSSKAQAAAIRTAYANAGITNFNETGYLECHGTGTLAGDPVEVAGAASVFATTRNEGQELIIGSIKSNIGHSEAAAGISGLIKAILAVERGMIPGNPTFLDPNPNIDFYSSRMRASRNTIKWPSTAVRRASVNSFGFGGANAHVVLEAAEHSSHVSSYMQKVGSDFFDSDNEDKALEAKPTLLVFSANDEQSLKNNIKSLSAHLINPGVSVDMADLAYTLSERRSCHYQRAFLVTRKSKIPQESITFGKKRSSPPKIGFIFTGQGAQWSQMGLDLVKIFPTAKKVLQRLDDVLQTLPSPPEWSLVGELTEFRSAERLRQPEFSQPLVTALQLAILRILSDWDITPEAVVGHSSGEIAAAAAAGLITAEEAIKIAYYRGQAAKKVGPDVLQGMLAVGTSAEEIESYLKSEDSKIQIACYNGPTSLTLSGTVSALEKLRDRLQQENYFARMLLVDLAYHSDYMTVIGEEYEKMLLGNCDLPQKCDKASKAAQINPVRMFSSVTAQLMNDSPIAAYWKRNMVSPVRFSQAAAELLHDQQAPNFLIEIGPSNALSGPIAQIKKQLSGVAADVEYTSALTRGTDAILPLFGVAGRLFLAGGSVNLHRVNQHDLSRTPAVIADLPNYSWNHSTRYWHETMASKDWRFKRFINHDLLGSKMNGTPWSSPVFKKVLKLADMPWLQDHKLGDQVVFPGAGYVAMAVEAVYQMTMMTEWKEQAPVRYRYRLRDLKFSRALVLEDQAESRIMLSLTPVPGSTRSWFEYKVSSLRVAVWTENSTGLVRIETDYRDKAAPEGAIEPLRFATPGRLWYKAMADAGYNFGPAFQNHLTVESTTGKRQSRSTVSMEAPASAYGQSFYPLHPACIDGCFQTVSPALWEGDRTTVGAVLVPAVVSSLIITAREKQPAEAISAASAQYLGIGRTDTPRNYSTNCSVYNPQDGSLLLEMKGLKFGELETSENEGMEHTFTRLSWDADVSMLLSAPKPRLNQFLRKRRQNPGDFLQGNTLDKAEKTQQESMVQNMIDLIAHKSPTLKVLEINMDPEDVTSLWMQGTSSSQSLIRAACSQYQFASSEPNTLVSAQEKHSPYAPNAGFSLFDLSKAEPVIPDVRFDLIIFKVSKSVSEEALKLAVESVRQSVDDCGLILAIGNENSADSTVLEAALDGIALENIHALDERVYICQPVSSRRGGQHSTRPKIYHISFLEINQKASKILESLRDRKWNVQSCLHPLSEIQTSQTVLVLDELSVSVMDRLDERQWDILQHLVQKECRILWVTSGAQLDATNPTRAAINGFSRVLHAEEPLLRMITLDVEEQSGDASAIAIDSCLEELIGEPASKQQIDSEFVERHGILHVSRVLPDRALTDLQSDEISRRKTEVVNLHAYKNCIRLRAERLGNIDSIHYGEISPDPLPLRDGCIEVELFAAGLNYKDVVVTMGIVPGNEHTLGGEGAGIVTKISPGITSFEVGQRVVVFDKGTFANRIQTTPGRMHRIPDWMTFEEASTLSAVYLTSIYSLFDLANLVRGQRVLIHSAAGGVGIAAIQLCQYVGAEIYATVGTVEKRQFLKSTFGLSDDHIFSSRTTDFAEQILIATKGMGVDFVLNSLTGELLDESWRILADGGTMVEIGKKDILDRNSLAMEPFDRNISFRAVDMSHERAPDHLVSRLMSKLFELIEQGHVKPIAPIHRFSYLDIPSAIRFLRAGKHIGKIVISAGSESGVKVPVRLAPQSLNLDSHACYLIVGGLKGLCASLAVYLAKSGAKRLAVMSRSGHEDEKSQGVVKEVQSLGCEIDLLTGDVSVLSDVENAFRQTKARIAGIIQGAMVLRDRTFSSMTVKEYHGALACKIQGTWNLHNAAKNLNLCLDFFTMLSSISGVVGQKGQANYAAGNAFMDSFASYRRRLGQPACSVDLGVIEDVGYIHERDGMQQKLDTSIWTGINERLLRKILFFSICQQHGDPLSSASSTQMITGIPVPQPNDSQLIHDARFASLFTRSGNAGGASGGGVGKDGSGSKEVQALLLLLRSNSADQAARLAATVDVVNKCFMRILRLSEPMDTGRPLSVYGIDSLATVEIRNWLRVELGALVTTLDIMNASSLIALCEKVVNKMTAS